MVACHSLYLWDFEEQRGGKEGNVLKSSSGGKPQRGGPIVKGG